MELYFNSIYEREGLKKLKEMAKKYGRYTDNNNMKINDNTWYDK